MTKNEFLIRESEIREALAEYPDLEMGEAYRRWKNARGEEPTYIHTGMEELHKIKAELRKSATRPCDQVGCPGIQHLEGICSGCIEGRKGYKSKWTCDECLHRELSKKEFLEWLKELSGSEKPSS